MTMKEFEAKLSDIKATRLEIIQACCQVILAQEQELTQNRPDTVAAINASLLELADSIQSNNPLDQNFKRLAVAQAIMSLYTQDAVSHILDMLLRSDLKAKLEKMRDAILAMSTKESGVN
jgi:hypothetical protein